MFLKRKSSRPTRERLLDTDNDDQQQGEDGSAEVTESPSTLASKVKKRSKPKAKSRLSFGGDDDANEDAIPIRRSNLRANLVLDENGVISNATSQDMAPSISTLSISSQNQSRPSYSKEYLSELKASTPSSSSRVVPPPSDDTFDINGAVVENLDEISMLMGAESPPADAAAPSDIPSLPSINAAKAKRERLRSQPQGENDDYISLTVTQYANTMDTSGPHPESRLMREDDELGDAEDEMAEYTEATDRIALGRKSRKLESQKKKAGIIEMIEDAEDDEDDEESREWEEKQVRRAQTQNQMDQNTFIQEKSIYKPTPIPPPTPLPSLEPAIARLSTILATLTTSHASSTTSLNNFASEENILETKEADLRSLVVRSEDKRAWFDEMRTRMDDCGAFLDIKFPPLEKIEKDHLSFIREKSGIVQKRREADDQDDLTLFLGIPDDVTKDRRDNEEKEERDEFGRIKVANPAAARKDRLSRRSARHAARTRPLTGSSNAKKEEEEGYSTDSSLSRADTIDYKSAEHELAGRRTRLMADVVAPEYTDPAEGIGKWFAEWREKHKDSYTNAWGGLGLVAAWEFWARMEITGWDPVEDSRSLDSFTWFMRLHEYCHVEGVEEEEDLAAAMVSTVITPRLCAVLEKGAFDPYSSQHTRRLVELCEEVECYVPRADIKFQAILKSALVPFRDAISSISSMISASLSYSTSRSRASALLSPEGQISKQRFQNRRLKLLQNLVRWRKYADDLFGVGELVTEAVEKCIFPLAQGADKQIMLHKMQGIVPMELVPNTVET